MNTLLVNIIHIRNKIDLYSKSHSVVGKRLSHGIMGNKKKKEKQDHVNKVLNSIELVDIKGS